MEIAKNKQTKIPPRILWLDNRLTYLVTGSSALETGATHLPDESTGRRGRAHNTQMTRPTSKHLTASLPRPQNHFPTAVTEHLSTRYNKLCYTVRHFAQCCSDCKGVSCVFSEPESKQFEARAWGPRQQHFLSLFKGHSTDIGSRISLE